MKLRIHDKRQAIALRQQGHSYSEIMRVIPNLSKGTISGWLKNIELSSEHRQRIIEKAASIPKEVRLRGAWANKAKALQRIEAIRQQAKNDFRKLAREHLFIAGIMLYWAEGSKSSRCFQFMNSDWRIIDLMLRFLREVVKVDEELIKIRLFIHRVYQDENCEKYWSSVTKIPIERFQKTVFKPSPHILKKNQEYKGCCRIEITRSEIFWKIIEWEELLFKTL